MKQKYLQYFLGVCAVSILCWGVVTFTQLQECVSNSLVGIHYILFLKTSHHPLVENTDIKRGDIVSIQGYAPAYVGEKHFSKRVLGLPGDLILKGKREVRIMSKTSVSKTRVSKTREPTTLPLLKKTGDGKPLTPISASSVPEGYVFVAGDNSNSFDSRYEEFGLVPSEKIWGKALFAW